MSKAAIIIPITAVGTATSAQPVTLGSRCWTRMTVTGAGAAKSVGRGRPCGEL